MDRDKLKEKIDFYENREAMKALRGKFSRRAETAAFNEWMAREICEYIDLLCQAAAGAKGETVSAPMEPLHSDIIAEAVRKVSWQPDAFNVRCDENGQIFVSADGQPIMDFPARVALELGEALVTLAANSQSSTEERSDTERPANAESSLTPQIPSPPQEKENA